MRDLIFKNLTSRAKKRKIISSLETTDRAGLHSVIRRHFIGVVREIEDDNFSQEPLPSVYILKEHNNKEQRGRFLCRIKGRIYLNAGGRRFIIFFIHSLKITLCAAHQGYPATQEQ